MRFFRDQISFIFTLSPHNSLVLVLPSLNSLPGSPGRLECFVLLFVPLFLNSHWLCFSWSFTDFSISCVTWEFLKEHHLIYVVAWLPCRVLHIIYLLAHNKHFECRILYIRIFIQFSWYWYSVGQHSHSSDIYAPGGCQSLTSWQTSFKSRPGNHDAFIWSLSLCNSKIIYSASQCGYIYILPHLFSKGFYHVVSKCSKVPNHPLLLNTFMFKFMFLNIQIVSSLQRKYIPISFKQQECLIF